MARSTAVRVATVGFAALASLAVSLPAAHASGGDGRVETQGACSQASDWRLSAKPDNGRIEVEYEVDSNVVGQTWQYRITDNGAVVAQGTRVTTAPSGSFTVSVRAANLAGVDHFTGQARNSATGETCSGRVNL